MTPLALLFILAFLVSVDVRILGPVRVAAVRFERAW